MYIYNMERKSNHIELLLIRYKILMEEAYNLREVDPALSDYDFYEGMKLRSLLEAQHRLVFKKSTLELLD